MYYIYVALTDFWGQNFQFGVFRNVYIIGSIKISVPTILDSLLEEAW